MKKEDLKPGMFIKLSEYSELHMVILTKNGLALVKPNGNYICLDVFNDNLKSKVATVESVFIIKHPSFICDYIECAWNPARFKLIWKREYSIGDTFQYGTATIKVEKSVGVCTGCCFHTPENRETCRKIDKYVGSCSCLHRSDKQNVIFKEV